jgi:murein DD-endopeptidase MepM/ murein hydrolase activator NlpD
MRRLLFLSILALCGLVLVIRPTAAQDNRPFRLPFESDPGPATWYLGQPYGNTTGAYRQRSTTYVNGQGIHFGVDFIVPCGTPVVAIGDGIVFHVDGPHGSAPHNVVIQHPNGYSSLYGHLLQRSTLVVGSAIRAGDVVGLSGTDNNDCNVDAHLHLEIRDHSRTRLYNPMTLIDVDWNMLALLGPSPRTFQRDLADPRRWQSLLDQPPARLQGPLLNDFATTWPSTGGGR